MTPSHPLRLTVSSALPVSSCPACSSNITGTLPQRFPYHLIGSHIVARKLSPSPSLLLPSQPSSSLSLALDNLVCLTASRQIAPSTAAQAVASRLSPFLPRVFPLSPEWIYVCVSILQTTSLASLLLLSSIPQPHSLPLGHKRPRAPPLPALLIWPSNSHCLSLNAFSLLSSSLTTTGRQHIPHNLPTRNQLGLSHLGGTRADPHRSVSLLPNVLTSFPNTPLHHFGYKRHKANSQFPGPATLWASRPIITGLPT